MSIFMYTLKRLGRNKIQLLFIFLFPILFMCLSFVGQIPTVKIGWVDHDQSELTKVLRTQLEDKGKLTVISEEEINDKLKGLHLDYVIVMQEQFTEDILQGNMDGVTVYSIEESNYSAPIHAYVQGWIQHVSSIAQASGGDRSVFEQGLHQYAQMDAVKIETPSTNSEMFSRIRSLTGYLVIALLYTAMITSLYLLMNRNNYTMYRSMLSQVSLRQYLLQTTLAFICVNWLQISIALSLIYLLYGNEVITDLWSIAALLFVFSFVTVAFGSAVAMLCKTVVQACLVGIAIIAPMAMLGGAYFPLDSAPEVMIKMGQFSPVSWIITGIEEVLQGATIFSLGKEVLILLLFAIVFFLIGLIRKEKSLI